MQKFVHGLAMVLVLLLGVFQAEAETSLKYPGKHIDLSIFDELEKAYILKISENMLTDIANDLIENASPASKGGGNIKIKKIVSVHYAMLSLKANEDGLALMSELYAMKADALASNIRGTMDIEAVISIEKTIEDWKQEYFTSIMQRYRTKKSLILPPAELEKISASLKEDIHALALDSVYGDE